jgi:3-oxoacyl-[acyl-carrier-protein] synthase III
MKTTKTMTYDINVVAVGHHVPELVVTNDDLAKIVETSDEWITTRTGIKERRFSKGETSADLACKAALDAISRYAIDKDTIDLIIVATITEPQKTPSTANIVQGMLGLTHDVMGFDINAACTGFLYALETASALLSGRRFRRALVIGSEHLSKVTDMADRNTCVLFGDGAGAMIIERGDASTGATFLNKSLYDTEGSLTVTDAIRMDGRKVYQFATSAMASAINEILETTSLSKEDISMVVSHQANIRIIESVAKTLGLPMSLFPTNIGTYGNTSAASIPILLSELAAQGKLAFQRILMVAFGGGFTWGSAVLMFGGLS